LGGDLNSAQSWRFDVEQDCKGTPRMKAFAFALLTGIAGLTAAAANAGPLVTASELNGLAAGTDPIILDIRGGAYAKGHIEGAVSAPYALFRGPAENPGQLVPEDQLETTYEDLGLVMD